MMEATSQTIEIGQTTLQLRDDLRFQLHGTGENAHYIVEDVLSGQFYQIGLVEYNFLSLLNGQRTLDETVARFAQLYPETAITSDDASRICRWAIESRLVEYEFTAEDHETHVNKKVVQSSIRWLNPISIKIPLFSPEPVLQKVGRYFHWIFSPVVVWLLVAFCAVSFLQLAFHWESFFTNQVQAFSAGDLFWIAVVWCGLKAIHESGHAFACHKHGCEVREAGIIFLLFIPLPYLDVTSTWRLGDRRSRMIISAAGMLFEFITASAAIWLWLSLDPGVIKQHAGNLILVATVHTLLFNANPLMRFDGYYLLSDGLSIPNLYKSGRAFVKDCFKFVYFGQSLGQPQNPSRWRQRFIQVYGWLSFCWFFLVTIGLLVAAANFINGIGLIMAIMAAGLWFGIPTLRVGQALFASNREVPLNRFRFAIASSLTAGLLAIFLFLVPSPNTISAPLVVDFETASIVRSKTTGMVDQIHVQEGQRVLAGQLLVSLRNQELRSQLDGLNIDIEISQRRIDDLLAAGYVAELKLEQQSLVSMQNRRGELIALVNNLEVRAPISGIVICRELESKTGTHFRQGDPIMEIAQPDRLHAIAMARQADLPWLKDRAQANQACELFVDGLKKPRKLNATLAWISPQATRELIHDTFDGSQGGMLPVLKRSQLQQTRSSQANDSILTTPRIVLHLQLSIDDQSDLAAGQTGTVYLTGRKQNMANYLFEKVASYFDPGNLQPAAFR